MLVSVLLKKPDTHTPLCTI